MLDLPRSEGVEWMSRGTGKSTRGSKAPKRPPPYHDGSSQSKPGGWSARLTDPPRWGGATKRFMENDVTTTTTNVTRKVALRGLVRSALSAALLAEDCQRTGWSDPAAIESLSEALRNVSENGRLAADENGLIFAD